MANAILSLARDPVLRSRLGENGRKYVASHYNRKEIAGRFERLLLESLSKSCLLHGKTQAGKSHEKSQREALNLNPPIQSKADE
jgi:hypothetical protein